MSIYLVKNARNEEIGAYSDLRCAEELAEQLQSASLARYSVEELVLAPESQ